eukprot:4292322-Prymnesium_polylepis.1
MDNECPRWAWEGYCTHPDFAAVMSQNCKGACGLCPSPPSPPPPPPGHVFTWDPQDEEGTHALSSWSDGGAYPFTRTSIGTPTTSTGPQLNTHGHHGPNAQSQYYMYAEASSPRQPGDLFALVYDGSECTLDGKIVSLITFDYH